MCMYSYWFVCMLYVCMRKNHEYLKTSRHTFNSVFLDIHSPFVLFLLPHLVSPHMLQCLSPTHWPPPSKKETKPTSSIETITTHQESESEFLNVHVIVVTIVNGKFFSYIIRIRVYMLFKLMFKKKSLSDGKKYIGKHRHRKPINVIGSQYTFFDHLSL